MQTKQRKAINDSKSFISTQFLTFIFHFGGCKVYRLLNPFPVVWKTPLLKGT